MSARPGEAPEDAYTRGFGDGWRDRARHAELAEALATARNRPAVEAYLDGWADGARAAAGESTSGLVA